MDPYQQQEFGDIPLPRFGHTVTMPINSDHAILFGGAVGCSNNYSYTNQIYSFDLKNRQWQKIQTTGTAPSPRAGHGAVCIQKNIMLLFGGATKGGLASDDLYFLEMFGNEGKWNIVNVGRKTPGKRYGHTFCYLKPYVIVFGGISEEFALNDLWVLNIEQKPLRWEQIQCQGPIPSPRNYHSASLLQIDQKEESMIILGGRSQKREPLSDVWSLKYRQSIGWTWIKIPTISKLTPRYQHTTHIVNQTLIVVGGRSNTLQNNNIQLIDLKTNIISQLGAFDTIRHSSFIYESQVFIIGGIPSLQNKPIEGIQIFSIHKIIDNDTNKTIISTQPPSPKTPLQRKSSTSPSSPISPTTSQKRRKTKLCQRIKLCQPVLGQKDEIKNIIKMSKNIQLNEDIALFFLKKYMRPKQFLHSDNIGVWYRPQHVITLCQQAQQIISSQPMLLHARAPLKIFGDIHGQLSDLMSFFRLYGAPFENGKSGDIQNYDYVFLGDYVDRGKNSLQTICLLLALKILYPTKVHLLRGNHEDEGVNQDFGFMEECEAKMDEDTQSQFSVYKTINRLFEWLPLGAICEDQILCVHGGIGKKFRDVNQIMQIERPLSIVHEAIDDNAQLILDILWSDPTESDQHFGITINQARDLSGSIVSFGPDIVHQFLKNNDLSMIIRAHECVMDGFQRFAGGSLITVFSATDYSGKSKNAGAILVLKTNMQIIPKLVYPSSGSQNGWLQQGKNGKIRAGTPPRWRINN